MVFSWERQPTPERGDSEEHRKAQSYHNRRNETGSHDPLACVV